MNILSNLSNTNHNSVFFSLCENADEIVMVSPFCYSNFTEFANSIKAAGSVSKIVFITTAKKDEIVGKIDSLLSFRKEMERIGVQWELRVDDDLHGKIYIFKSGGQPFAGIITSANLTHRGMEENHEWGVQIDDVQLLTDLETQIIACAPDALSALQLEDIKDRVKTAYPMGVQKPKPAVVAIDDIVRGYQVPQGSQIFIKPIGVSEKPIFAGDFSKEKYMHFSKRQPKAVRVGDILIAYAVGARQIIGVFKVTSNPIKIDDNAARWPWYVTSECLTPHLANHTWECVCPVVTQIAKSYVKAFGKPITHTGGKTLGALNRGSDKIQLDNKYGLYLLSKLMELDGRC